MEYQNFKQYLLENSTGQVLKHAQDECFPYTKNYRKIKGYINSIVNLTDVLIHEFNRYLDEYEILRVLHRGGD